MTGRSSSPMIPILLPAEFFLSAISIPMAQQPTFFEPIVSYENAGLHMVPGVLGCEMHILQIVRSP